MSKQGYKELFEFLNQQIYGASMDDDEAEEHERQKAFNEAKSRELEARAAEEEGDEDKSRSHEGDDVERQ